MTGLLHRPSNDDPTGDFALKTSPCCLRGVSAMGPDTHLLVTENDALEPELSGLSSGDGQKPQPLPLEITDQKQSWGFISPPGSGDPLQEQLECFENTMRWHRMQMLELSLELVFPTEAWFLRSIVYFAGT